MDYVYDSWWPWRWGKIVKRTKTTVTVKWGTGDIWKYDKAHQQWLRKLKHPTGK